MEQTKGQHRKGKRTDNLLDLAAVLVELEGAVRRRGTWEGRMRRQKEKAGGGIRRRRLDLRHGLDASLGGGVGVLVNLQCGSTGWVLRLSVRKEKGARLYDSCSQTCTASPSKTHVKLVAGDGGVLRGKLLRDLGGRGVRWERTGEKGREQEGAQAKNDEPVAPTPGSHLKLGADHAAGAAPRGGKVDGNLW